MWSGRIILEQSWWPVAWEVLGCFSSSPVSLWPQSGSLGWSFALRATRVGYCLATCWTAQLCALSPARGVRECMNEWVREKRESVYVGAGSPQYSDSIIIFICWWKVSFYFRNLWESYEGRNTCMYCKNLQKIPFPFPIKILGDFLESLVPLSKRETIIMTTASKKKKKNQRNGQRKIVFVRLKGS